MWNVQTDLGNRHDLMEEQYRKQKFLKKDGTQREPLHSLADRELLKKKVTLCCHSLRYKHSGSTLKLNSLRAEH